MRLLLEYWPILLCWGKIRPSPWLKYNVSYFPGLVCIHLDLVWQKYCGFPKNSFFFNFKFVPKGCTMLEIFSKCEVNAKENNNFSATQILREIILATLKSQKQLF